MNEPTKRCLIETYKELMERVEKDATPENLERIKRVIGIGNLNGIPTGIDEIHKVFEDPSLNVFNLPFNEMLKLDSGNLSKCEEMTRIEELLAWKTD